jgi:DNA-binding response OmpR family regulator
MASVYLVEDDLHIRESVARALTGKGHTVRSAGRATVALTEIVDEPPDVVVLDLGLPDLDGAQVLKMLRAVSSVPVLVATARDDEDEIVRLLDAGADDYLVKPFSGEQLEARVRAVLRRAAVAAPSGEVVVGGLRIDPGRRRATLDGAELDLSRKEFELLLHLAANAGRVVPRRELLAEVWQQPLGAADKTLEVHLSWLRRKLGESAAEPRYLRTVRGVGIMLLAPGS